MPLPTHLLEEMAARRRHEAVQADRDRLRDHVRTALLCVVWCCVGLYLLGMAFHTTDVELGGMYFLGGLAAGNGGIIFTLLAAYRRGERRGDW